MIIKQDPVFVRRRRVAAAVLLTVVLVLVVGIARVVSGSGDTAPPATPATAAPRFVPTTIEVPAPPVRASAPQGEPGAPADTALVQIQRITGGLTSKSVVASPRGQVFAQNMMYTHSISVFAPDGAKVRTIDDSVDLAAHGVEGHPGRTKGAPVEMAFSPDGSRAWVSNYAMYGSGFAPEGKDACRDDEGQSHSYVYEIDTTTFEVVRVVEVGAVPKYVALTPDGKRVLVTNWCSMSLSVIDAATAKVVSTVDLPGTHPRGIAVSPDSRTAFVALMGSDTVVRVDLAAGTVSPFADTGRRPRHLVISPDGRRLYVSNNDSNDVVEVDTATAKVLRRAAVGTEPRSMAISPDGGALYVGNYSSQSVSKIRTSDLEVVQTVPTDTLPIGITYEPTKKRVWVASYNGSIVVYDDSRLPGATS